MLSIDKGEYRLFEFKDSNGIPEASRYLSPGLNYIDLSLVTGPYVLRVYDDLRLLREVPFDLPPAGMTLQTY
ncbi:MAG: hypothetical protein KDB53_07875 [Planctomycetes bacterium]|nr:hypothetical protein [Planctomycetota bacterium]